MVSRLVGYIFQNGYAELLSSSKTVSFKYLRYIIGNGSSIARPDDTYVDNNGTYDRLAVSYTSVENRSQIGSYLGKP